MDIEFKKGQEVFFVEEDDDLMPMDVKRGIIKYGPEREYLYDIDVDGKIYTYARDRLHETEKEANEELKTKLIVIKKMILNELKNLDW